ncbi:MAG: hypothetical protein ABIO70_35605 [Pseudomonadota bacterium]
METIPPWAWTACALAVAAVIVELVLWYKLHPALLPTLLLRHQPTEELPRVQNPAKLDGFTGNGFTVTWRYDRDARAVIFRRRMTMGRKAYMMAAVRFGRDGRATVHWVPSPLLIYPLMPVAILPFVASDGGLHDLPLFMGVIGIALLFSAAINTLGAWWFLKKTGLPELRQQIEGWLG